MRTGEQEVIENDDRIQENNQYRDLALLRRLFWLATGTLYSRKQFSFNV
jgi:hypothetical protein